MPIWRSTVENVNPLRRIDQLLNKIEMEKKAPTIDEIQESLDMVILALKTKMVCNEGKKQRYDLMLRETHNDEILSRINMMISDTV